MVDQVELLRRLGGLHEKLAASHPKLVRGQVWCRHCGYTETVSSAYAFKHGWPKHCGCTMTIDPPEEWSRTPTTPERSDGVP